MDSIYFANSLLIFEFGFDEEFLQLFKIPREPQTLDSIYFANTVSIFERGFDLEFLFLFGYSRFTKIVEQIDCYTNKYSKKLENALFSGYDALLKYYTPIIYNKCFSFSSTRRTTLNFSDLQQICSIKLLECWNKQQIKTTIKCFDAFFKQACGNCLKTQYTKAHCGRRGSQEVTFLSEIEENGEYFPDENSVKDRTDKFIKDCKIILGEALGNIFELLVSSGNEKFSKKAFVEVSEKHGIPYSKIKKSAGEIVFILRGYKEELLGHQNFLSA